MDEQLTLFEVHLLPDAPVKPAIRYYIYRYDSHGEKEFFWKWKNGNVWLRLAMAKNRKPRRWRTQGGARNFARRHFSDFRIGAWIE